MTVMTLNDHRPTAAASTTSDRVTAAAIRMYEAEFALHAARQTEVDAWIVAAYSKLHAAIADHTAALQDLSPAHPTAA
jgi:hypothetical protein